MESLMQRMNNLTEELKAKDLLLAESEVRTEQLSRDSSRQPPTLTQENHLSPETEYLPPPSSSPPPTMYKDDDVYMRAQKAPAPLADSEANKLREDRGIKKDMRKWKARQVEDDEDIYMGDSEENEWREERRIKEDMRKRKGKARQVEDEDEGMESSHDSESDVAEQLEDEESDENENNLDDGNLSDINGDVNFDKDDEVIEAEVVRPYITPDPNCC